MSTRSGRVDFTVALGTRCSLAAASTFQPHDDIAFPGHAGRIAFPGHAGRCWPLARWRSLARTARWRSLARTGGLMTSFGVHTGLQNISVDELRAAWRRIEELGFDWISIWDHLYGATGNVDDATCLEAVTMHAALALETSRVQCGALVYSVGFRHPAVLAKAVTAIDLCPEDGPRSASAPDGPRSSTPPMGSTSRRVATRMDQLEECAACVRGLLHDEVTSFDGRWFTLREARNEPRPVQARLPIWIGGGGERRTLRIAAALRRRMERAVHVSGDVQPQARRAPRTLRRRSGATRARSGAPSTSAWRGPRTASATSSGRSPTSFVPVCSAAPSPRSSTASASTSPAAPIRSTSRSRPVRRRRPRALRLRLGTRADGHWLSRRCFCASNSSAVSVPRLRIASRRSSRSITSLTAAWSALG